MQGASSAFGAVTARRKDLDIGELLRICSEGETLEARAELLKKYAAVYPELKFFLIVAYFCKNAFSQIMSIGPLDYLPSKVEKGASVENLQSMWNEVSKMYDTFPSGPKVKRGRAQRILGDLHADDAKILHSLISGTFYMKELNELVVKAAFPELVPNV